MAPRVLRPNITKEDDSWKFTVPPNELVPRRPGFGKTIRFSGTQILFQMGQLSNNRVLQGDDPSKFILVSFSLPRYPDWTPREGSEYMSKLFAAGLFVNNVQYRFYHHSNSQLKSRSCYMRQASNDEELDGRIYQLGDFGRIMNVAKRAKRIGLLYSESQVDFSLDPRFIQDIRDLESGDEVFSDGCGLISRSLAIQVSKRKKIIFRGVRYTPCVFQIRYLGYKGVLMLHPDIDRKNELKKRQDAGASSLTPEQQQYLHSGDADWSICLAQFRRSMKKFTATQSPTFSVVGYSQPYSFGRLNNEIIVLLSSLGVPSENFVKRQQDYFDWITQAEHDPIAAVDLLSAMGKFDIAERLLLDGMDTPTVRSAISSAQKSEVAAFKKDDGKDRSRIIVKQSRKIYGVCDPYRVLKEGEVHVKITSGRGGATALIHGDVLVVRNPCLHPGDCLKLRAVQHPLLSHLVDCIVFASVARPDHHSAPSMSSGGDLDGDQYFVCWDPALVPSTVSEAYDYPPNKERTNTSISRKDLANHFANYNNASLGRVSKLHNLWAMAMPNGALCSECQELSALHSQCVDGAIVKPPERLTNPPKRAETEPPYITELLKKRAIAFSESFLSRTTREEGITSTPKESSMQLVLRLLQSRPVELALSEYELFTLAYRIALRDGLDHSSFFGHLDCGALTASQKHSICFALNLSYDEYAHLWNSFLRSDLLSRADLYQRNLSRPFSLHRLYSSKSQGMGPFFRYLNMALQDYTRKILILKTDERFVLAIFMRGEIMWEDDTDVDENVVVCAFLPHSTSNFSNYIPCTTGYRLFCGPSRLQLYDKQIADSFVFMTVPPKASGSEVIVSVALGKISNRVKQNLGRVNRQGISGIELHVVSNRDTVAHQLFDLWFDHIPTENRVRRFDREPRPYRRYSLDEVDWEAEPRPADFLATLFKRRLSKQKFLEVLSAIIIMSQWQDVMSFAVRYHAEEEMFWLFEFVISQPAPLHRTAITMMVDMHPPLVYTLLHKFPPDPDTKEVTEELKGLVKPILSNLVRSANDFPFPVLVAMEKISGTIAKLSTVDYLDLLWLASLSVRAPQLVQEVLLVLDDSRVSLPDIPPVHVYLHKFGKGVAFDRAEEAADECPCNEDGRPRKQKTAPVKTTLKFVPGEPLQVKAVLRVDARTSIRLHSHVRLQAASHLELSVSTRDSDTIPPLLDAMVIQAAKGEITLEVLQPLPPELEEMDWNLYHAGITATSKAMMDALIRLAEKRSECCAFYHLLVGESSDHTIPTTTPTSTNFSYGPDLNDSQKLAIDSIDTPISLIWGPPGTGKTTVVVQILRKLIEEATEEGLKILMTASTHNAVDNVLERFIAENEPHNILPVAQILRVATDVSKVNKNLRSYTVDARVGGELHENNKLIKQAQKRLEEARLIFSTCAGAGLGILRKAEFDIALIDEASQVTEPCALIPLVKGVKRAILVGDHVQLRPTVKKMGKVLQFDMSLMERLYTGREASPEISKTMLDTQYRFPQELAAFPSREFYEGKLRSGLPNGLEKLRTLPDGNDFPWPRNATNVPIPCVFVQCSVEEDMGGMSKCNHGQVDVVEAIIKLLKPRSNVAPLLVTNLSPYTHQIRELRHRLPDVPSFTVDSFQGRESDVIIFSAVRCNAQHDIGFLDDARRLNVMWTRARRGLIIVGDRETMESDQLWKRALNSCAVAEIQVPERRE